MIFDSWWSTFINWKKNVFPVSFRLMRPESEVILIIFQNDLANPSKKRSHKRYPQRHPGVCLKTLQTDYAIVAKCSILGNFYSLNLAKNSVFHHRLVSVCFVFPLFCRQKTTDSANPKQSTWYIPNDALLASCYLGCPRWIEFWLPLFDK